MLNVTTARAAAKETKFEYEQCYVVDVVSELSVLEINFWIWSSAGPVE